MSFAEPRSVTSPLARTPGPVSPGVLAVATAGAGDVTVSTRRTVLLLGAVALAALLIQGGLFVHKTWLWTGDTIYHRASTGAAGLAARAIGDVTLRGSAKLIDVQYPCSASWKGGQPRRLAGL